MAETPRLRAIPETSDDKPRISRRRLMIGWGLAVAAAYGASVGGRDTFEALQTRYGKGDAETLFENDGMFNWRKLSVVPNLVQIDRSALVSYGMFDPPSSEIDCPPGGFTVVDHPFAVRDTILRNIDDYEPGMQSRVGRALPYISPGLLAFYEPGPGNFVYLDADASDGLVVPISENPIVGRHLGVENVDITGREIRGNVVYPYTSKLGLRYRNGSEVAQGTPTPIETFQFYGQSFNVANAQQLDVTATNYYAGIDPIAFPSP